MSMSRFAVATLVAGFVTFGGVRFLHADDPAPAPLSDAEASRIKQLVENLGSDDFRLREAATKALIEMGEKARAAITQATNKSAAEDA